jgi:Protein of unknown function (DUF3040)
MDDDPVLRCLADDLQRDDPRLAAILEGRSSGRRHVWAWLLFGLALLALPLFLPVDKVLGVLGLLVVIGSPLVVGWLIS